MPLDFAPPTGPRIGFTALAAGLARLPMASGGPALAADYGACRLTYWYCLNG